LSYTPDEIAFDGVMVTGTMVSGAMFSIESAFARR